MKKSSVIPLFLFLCFSLNAQKLPTSIYTFSSLNTVNKVYTLNKKLNLTNHTFVIVDQIDLDTNAFSMNTKNLGRKPSEFIYDDYKRYQDNNLLKGFLLKNDPTRWNPINFKSRNELIKELKSQQSLTTNYKN